MLCTNSIHAYTDENDDLPICFTDDIDSNRTRKNKLHVFAVYLYLYLGLYRFKWPSAVFESHIDGWIDCNQTEMHTKW